MNNLNSGKSIGMLMHLRAKLYVKPSSLLILDTGYWMEESILLMTFLFLSSIQYQVSSN